MRTILTLIIMISSLEAFSSEESFVEALNRRINENVVKGKEQYRKIASVEKRHQVSFGLGQFFMFNDFSEHISDSFGFQLGYQYKSELPVNFRMDVEHISSGNNSVTGFKPTFAYKIYQQHGMSFEPIGGLGFYNISIGDSDTVFGFHIGARANLMLNDKYEVFFSTSYNNPFESGDNVGGSYQNLLIGFNYSL